MSSLAPSEPFPLAPRSETSGQTADDEKSHVPLSEDELRERLRLHSPGLVKELYDLAIRQVQLEVARQQRIDSKATSLLGAVGLSLTVALTFGGQILLSRAAQFQKGGAVRWDVIIVVFGIAVGAGLVASGFALAALRVGKLHIGLHERNIFSAKELREADQVGHEKENDNAAVAEYRRYMIPELWRVAQRNGVVLDGKARYVQVGQYFFFAFLAMLLLIGVFLLTSVATAQ